MSRGSKTGAARSSRKPNAVPGGAPMPLDRKPKAATAIPGGGRPSDPGYDGAWTPGYGKRKRANVTPGGGSPRPAMNYANRERGDGYGKPISEAPPASAEPAQSGTSIFDPVLAELLIRWFSPRGGTVLDSFAGGSVRGIVTSKLGRRYVGVELRAEQVAANRQQADEICAPESERLRRAPIALDEPSPIEEIAPGIWAKREDLFAVGKANGTKARTLARILAARPDGVIACGSRDSTMLERTAQVANALGIPCRVHTGEGAFTAGMAEAKSQGAEIRQHNPARLSVLKARAREDAAATGWLEVPWALECQENVDVTAAQVPEALPEGVRRIVVTVGSGMSLAGLLHGLQRRGLSVPVLGVKVGADAVDRLNRWAPAGWERNVTLVDAGLKYEEAAEERSFGSLILDPYYEAKCIPFLQPGDLLWIVGTRASAAGDSAPLFDGAGPMPIWHVGDSRGIDTLCEGVKADLLMSCPPYADLEVYSADPRDISTLSYPEFREAYFEIIAKSCALLKQDRFAVFVVGEVRGPDGFYYGLVPDTIRAFEAAGVRYYNEIILVTAVGSLPIRVGAQFRASRKVGKTHQNVLVFCKGDPKRAAEACGVVDVADPAADEEVKDAEPWADTPS